VNYLFSFIPTQGVDEWDLAALLQISLPTLRAALEKCPELRLEESVDIFPYPDDSSRVYALYNRKWRKVNE
jgi:hypothetical protein